jgi:elongation factor P
MPQANDLRKGNVINYNNDPHLVLDVQHRTPGNLRAFVQATIRNLRNGKSNAVRFSSTEAVEVLTTDTKKMEFSYEDRGSYYFMDSETFDTVEFPESLIEDAKSYLVPNAQVEVLFVADNPVEVRLPGSVNLKVTESPEGVRGDTASNVQKPATLETGKIIQVPLFIKAGDVVKVSTTDGSYMGRA